MFKPGGSVCINTLRPIQNDCQFPDIFKCHFLKENKYISIKIRLEFPKGPIHNIPVLVQIIDWRRPGEKPLAKPTMVSLLTHICITRCQCVNPYLINLNLWAATRERINHDGFLTRDDDNMKHCSFTFHHLWSRSVIRWESKYPYRSTSISWQLLLWLWDFPKSTPSNDMTPHRSIVALRWRHINVILSQPPATRRLFNRWPRMTTKKASQLHITDHFRRNPVMNEYHRVLLTQGQQCEKHTFKTQQLLYILARFAI